METLNIKKINWIASSHSREFCPHGIGLAGIKNTRLDVHRGFHLDFSIRHWKIQSRSDFLGSHLEGDHEATRVKSRLQWRPQDFADVMRETHSWEESHQDALVSQGCVEKCFFRSPVLSLKSQVSKEAQLLFDLIWPALVPLLNILGISIWEPHYQKNWKSAHTA